MLKSIPVRNLGMKKAWVHQEKKKRDPNSNKAQVYSSDGDSCKGDVNKMEPKVTRVKAEREERLWDAACLWLWVW